ncbi:MAG: carbohydrate ABC transporter permease [Eubacteriales bacterium]|nr:carbohydrate ABC transporter permease [Eubacteriales bacterium]
MEKRFFDMVKKRILLYAVCILVAFIMAVPFLWMLSASFKENAEIFTQPIQWIPKKVKTVNYEKVMEEIPFIAYFLNTAYVTVVITVIRLLTCSMAAFAFAKLRFPGRDKFFLIYLATMMVPWHAIMIPQFITIQKAGLYDSHLALILTGSFSAFGVFIMRQNMLSLPEGLKEAAKIDGCGSLRIFTQIALPLSKTGLATLTALTFTQVWNDYMAPMIYLDSDMKKTIQLGLATFKREFDTDYGAIMAGTVLSLVPVVIIYAMAQKYIVEGVAFTGLKG